MSLDVAIMLAGLAVAWFCIEMQWRFERLNADQHWPVFAERSMWLAAEDEARWSP